MKTTLPLRYHFLVYSREQLWLPIGLWALFALMVTVFRNDAKALDLAGGFLGIVLPLIGGVLAASVVIDDPALELQLSAPRPPSRLLLERLGIILGLLALSALAFQIFLVLVGVDLSFLGNLAVRQLVWLVPSLAMLGLSSLTALGFVQGTPGVLIVGAVWIIQLLLRDWFPTNDVARFVFLFMGARVPNSPNLMANQVCLAGLAAAFIFCAALLLQKEERYL